MPVSPPLSTTESGTATLVRPTNTLEFNGADFTVTGSGDKATISIDSTGTGAALTDTHIGFGNASNLLTGSANFTFTEESGGAGPQVLLTGDKPIMRFTDDTGATNYTMRFTQSGSSFYMAHEDSAGTDNGLFRLSSSYVAIQPTMTPRVGIGGYGESGVALKIEGTPNQILKIVDTTDDYSLTLTAGSTGPIIDFGLGTAQDDSMKIGVYDGMNKIDTKSRTLRVTGDGSTLMEIESTDAGSSVAPTLQLFRNSASPADGDSLGSLSWQFQDDGGGKNEAGYIKAYISDASAASEDADFYWYAINNGSLQNMIAVRGGIRAVEMNVNNADIDFIWNSDSTSDFLFCAASDDYIKVGSGSANASGATFQVPDNTISSYCNVNAVRSDSVATQVFVNNDCQGQMWVNNSATNWAFDLPESTVKGMWFKFVSTGGNITVDPNPSGGTSNTLNGGTASLTRSTDNQVYTVLCIAANTWVMDSP